MPTTELEQHDAALVEASGRLFRTHGYAGVSIDMIARAAGVSPKTIYARYGGKLGLFSAVIESTVRQPVGIWDALDPAGEPGSVLMTAADRFLAIVLSPDVLALERAIIAEAPRLPQLADVFYASGPRRGRDRLAAYLADQQARGTLRVADPSAAAELFISMIEGELVRRALFLGEEPGPDVRGQWLATAIGAFLRAQAPA